jgi:DNA-binding response OmpR family regulator
MYKPDLRGGSFRFPNVTCTMADLNDLLLVEDDIFVARALERRLAQRGMRACHVSHCGAAAMLTGPFALGIFDIDLPDGDGVELAGELLDRGVVQRAVFYTGSSNTMQLWRARLLGDVFRKSASLSALIDTVLPSPALLMTIDRPRAFEESAL